MEVLFSHHQANRLKEAPGFRSLQKQFKTELDAGRGSVAAFVEALLKQSDPAGDPTPPPLNGDGEPSEGLATCAPMSGCPGMVVS